MRGVTLGRMTVPIIPGSPAPLPEPPADPPASASGRSVRGWLADNWITAAVVAVFVGLVVLLALPDKPDPIDADNAVATCEEFVKDHLKAPSTAVFAGGQAQGAAPRWTVRGTVTAENSFGVPLEMDYTCTVRLDGDRFHLEALTGLS